MGKASTFVNPARGSYFTLVGANASSLSVPSDRIGGESHAAAGSLYAASVFGAKCEGVNVFGFTLSATDASARTLSFFTVDIGLDNYQVPGPILPIPASASVGNYYPIGGDKGWFASGRHNTLDTLLGGGFAFITSNNALRGIIWWEPVGAY